jgi:hypothetical protein
MTYGDLFEYLHRKLAKRGCDHELTFVKKFAERHDLDFGPLSQILEDLGGFCDCEVMFNVVCNDRIDPAQVIGQETFVTPRRYAIEHGLYCHCRISGVPVPWEEAVAAKREGVEVEWHVPCGKDDPYASPAVGRAATLIEKNGSKPKSE